MNGLFRFRLGLLLSVPILVSACGSAPPGPKLPDIVSLAGLPRIALYRLVDNRGTENAQLIGESSYHGQSGLRFSPHPIRAREPVDLTVTRAFVEGLTARGFAVVDRTTASFTPDQAAPGGVVVVSGEIAQYWWEHSMISTGLVPIHRDHASCTVVIRVYESAGGRLRSEKPYVAEGGGSGSLGSLDALQYALRSVVLQVATDPDFAAAVRGQGE